MAPDSRHGAADYTATKQKASRSDERSPIHLVDLGKSSAGAVRDLKRGRGALIDEVAGAVEQVKSGLGAEAAGKAILPVVVIVEQKQKSLKPLSMFPFSLMR